MKRYILIVCIALGIISTGCTKGFEDMNQNPNALNTPTPELLMNSSARGVLNLFGGDLNRVVTFNYTQMFVGFQGRFQRYSEDPQTLINYWRNAYVECLMPAQEIIRIYGTNPEFSNRVNIAKIWKCYVLSQIAAVWGPIPYEYGLNGDIIVNYNREQDVYYMLFDDLKAAAQALDEEGDKFARDPIFKDAGGQTDIMKWKKFANTLRLRLAMRISNPAPDGDPVKAKAVVEDVFADEAATMASDNDSAVSR